jgi:hypothetical protein
MNALPVLAGETTLVFAPTAFADSLVAQGYHTRNIRSFPNFHVSQLTGEFLNDKTRNSVLQSYSILSVTR